MKKHYLSPTVCCMKVNVSITLLQSSMATSDRRHTDESFSRRHRNFDAWGDDEQDEDDFDL